MTKIIPMGMLVAINQSQGDFMSPQQAIKQLSIIGLTQRDIANSLNQKGISTTQETISRISTGRFKSTSYEVGAGLINLLEKETTSFQKCG